MPKDYGPPSKLERQQLIAERKRDVPKPAPAPRPPGTIGAVIDAATAKRRMNAAYEREHRIYSIDEALKARAGQAKSGLAKATADKGSSKGPEKPPPTKSKAKTGKERVP